MRIILPTRLYPPRDTEGVARQRFHLAHALARLGHEIHVITVGEKQDVRRDALTLVHEFPLIADRTLGDIGIDRQLLYAQILYRGVAALRSQGIVPDIVDVPLAHAQGLMILNRTVGPTVLALQTTLPQQLRMLGRQASLRERWAIAFDEECLKLAHGVVADSAAILEVVTADYGRQSGFVSVVPHGIPPLEAVPRRIPQAHIQALVLGRLEVRKGTKLLLDLLPSLLHKYPLLTIRFVGRDNSAGDGFYAKNHLTYPEYFRRTYPSYAGRVQFDGYVDDAVLENVFATTDMLIAPSRFESFGLMYLEAMRAAIPIVAFATGAAREIFADSEKHGAILVPDGNAVSLRRQIERLVEYPSLRQQIGAAGYTRFQEYYTDSIMAQATIKHYERTIEHYSATFSSKRSIIQAVEHLSDGDAVSDIIRSHVGIFEAHGEPSVILTDAPQHTKDTSIQQLRLALHDPTTRLVIHYAAWSDLIWLLDALPGPHAIYYHNITPPEFFPAGSAFFRRMDDSYRQLAMIAPRFSLVIGDSYYNLNQLRQYVQRSLPEYVIYPVVEAATLQAEPYDSTLCKQLSQIDGPHILFVGRFVRNKRFDDLISIFDRFCSIFTPKSHLWLIGNMNFDRKYIDELKNQCRRSRYSNQIHFVGKIPRSSLIAYYRSADLFLCASEHEGFCVPLAEAMAFNIPIVARASSAIPETLGATPGLMEVWDRTSVTERMHQLLTDSMLREKTLILQRDQLVRFSANAARDTMIKCIYHLKQL